MSKRLQDARRRYARLRDSLSGDDRVDVQLKRELSIVIETIERKLENADVGRVTDPRPEPY